MTVPEQAVEAANELDSLYAQCAIKDRGQNVPAEFDDWAWHRFDVAARRAWPKITAALRAAALPLVGAEQRDAISSSDPLVTIAGIRQFGLASDGSDLRDLETAFARLSLPAQSGSGVREDVARMDVIERLQQRFAGHTRVVNEETGEFKIYASDEWVDLGEVVQIVLSLPKHTGQPGEGTKRVLDLVDELAHAEDAVAEDVGTGPRTPLVILRELVRAAEQTRALSASPASPQPREGEK